MLKQEPAEGAPTSSAAPVCVLVLGEKLPSHGEVTGTLEDEEGLLG